MLTISRPGLTHLEIFDVRRLAAEVIRQHIFDSRSDGAELAIQQVNDGMLDPWLEIVDFNTEYGRARTIEKIRAHVEKEDSRRNNGGKLTNAEVKVSKLSKADILQCFQRARFHLTPAAKIVGVPRGTLAKRCAQLGISTDRVGLMKLREAAGLRPVTRLYPLAEQRQQA